MILFTASRYILGVLFLFSAYYKLADPSLFASAVENYRVFGILLSHWSAVFIPMLELLLGLMLILGIWLKETFVITLLLYVIFDFMILQAFFRGLDISCGCFSSSATTSIGLRKILENSILTFLAALGLYWALHHPQTRFRKLKI